MIPFTCIGIGTTLCRGEIPNILRDVLNILITNVVRIAEKGFRVY